MQKYRHPDEEDRKTTPILEQIAKSKNRKNVLLGVFNVLSSNPDLEQGKVPEIRQTLTFVRSRVLVGPSEKKPYVPLKKGKLSIEDVLPLIRRGARNVDQPEDIEDLCDLSETDSLLTIANAIVVEDPVCLGEEDFELFNEYIGALSSRSDED